MVIDLADTRGVKYMGSDKTNVLKSRGPELPVDNQDATAPKAWSERLSDKDFNRLGVFITEHLGIKMPPVKKVLVESRLRRRLRILNLHSYTQYCDYLFSKEGLEKEVIHFINEITTNKTEFFREETHFHYLVEKALPELLRHQTPVGKPNILVWSAGCSTGEEPYTLSIVLSEYIRQHPGTRMDYRILATDVSARVLEEARKAIYTQERIDFIPMELRTRYFLRSKDRARKLVRVSPQLRHKVVFKRLNLMDEDFGLENYLDIIFCRNVIIYFDKETQAELLSRLANCLRTGGYLFMGHSEILDCSQLPLAPVFPTVYRKVKN